MVKLTMYNVVGKAYTVQKSHQENKENIKLSNTKKSPEFLLLYNIESIYKIEYISIL